MVKLFEISLAALKEAKLRIRPGKVYYVRATALANFDLTAYKIATGTSQKTNIETISSTSNEVLLCIRVFPDGMVEIIKDKAGASTHAVSPIKVTTIAGDTKALTFIPNDDVSFTVYEG